MKDIYLYELPASPVNPPVKTKKQSLPFLELSWEDFERLTLRYAEISGGVENTARLYGAKGQKQEGIDIYVRNNSRPQYSVYQCKRYIKYTVTNVKKAITDYKKGEWYSKSEAFYLCAACDLSDKNISDEIERQKKILNKDNKELYILDLISFSSELKAHPKIVYDFFGPNWANAFLGKQQCLSLENRLTTEDITQLRSKLGIFYKSLFDIHEGSIVNLSGDNSIPDFEQRYIIPDIDQNIQLSGTLDQQSTIPETPLISLDLIDDIGNHVNDLKDVKSKHFDVNTTIEQRVSALEWLSSEKNCVLVGGPGSGKSALLKYIVLLLLDVYHIEDAKFNQSKRKLIPVWLPFGFWTSLLDTNPNIGLIEAIKHFFKGHDRLDLWPIIQKALNDKRLFLLVDGLDEWSDEDSAAICFQKLTVFTKTHGISTIFSSRPNSIERLGIVESQWSIAKLSGLSDKQMSMLINICIEHRIKNIENIDSRFVDKQIQKEVNELNSEILGNVDLKELSSIPLMIYMLIHLKTKNISLPHSKFSVYKELVSDLVKMQPKRRKKAAQVLSRSHSFNDNELFELFAMLAFEMHKNHSHGAMSVDLANNYLAEYLGNPSLSFGFNRRDAKNSADDILHLGEDDIGIIVKTSPDEIGLFHRSFQEFLAAYYIASLSSDMQKELLSMHMSDSQWRDIFICLFALIQKNSDIEDLIGYVQTIPKTDIERLSVEIFLAQIAFGDNKCSAGTAKNIAKNVNKKIFDGSYYKPQRFKLLDIALSGYNSSKLQPLVKSLIDSAYPSNTRWISGVIDSASKFWPKDLLTLKFILKGMKSEDIYTLKSSSRALVNNYRGDERVLDELYNLFSVSTNRHQRLCISETIFRGWSQNKLSKTLYNSLKTSQDPVEKLLCILYDSLNGKVSKSAKDYLVSFASMHSYNFTWEPIVKECLIRDFDSDNDLRDLCIQRVFHNYSGLDNNLGFDVAIEYLLTCHWDDDILIDLIINDFKSEHPALSFRMSGEGKWDVIGKIMNKSKPVRLQVEEWIIKKGKIETTAYFYLKSEEGKKYLVKELTSAGSFPHWPAHALIKNWGMKDQSVKKAIKNTISKSSISASQIAFLYPKIFDKKECGEKLLELIGNRFQPKKRYDFILQAILNNNYSKEYIWSAYEKLKNIEFKDDSNTSGKWLLLYFNEHINKQLISDLAKEYITKRDGNLDLIARLFCNDNDIRSHIVGAGSKLEKSLRINIAHFLKSRNYDDYCFSKLKDYDLDHNPSVKIISSVGYYSSPLLDVSAENEETVLTRLSSDIIAGGMDHTERNQAALSGFIELGKLEDILSIKQPWKSDGMIGIDLNRGLDSNEYFLSYITENWDYISSVLKENALKIFNHTNDKSLSFLSLLSPYISKESTLFDEVVKKVSEGKEVDEVEDRLLHSLSKLLPKSNILLELSLKSLGFKKNGNHRTNHRESLVALDILEGHFYQSEMAIQMIEGHIKHPSVRDDVLLATMHALGMHDHEKAREINKRLKDKSVWIPLIALSIANPSKKTEDQVDEILKATNYLFKAPSNYSVYFYKKIIGAVASNPDLLVRLESEVTSTKDIQKSIFMLQILTAIKGASKELISMVMAAYSMQGRRKFAETIFDITIGEFVPPQYSLLKLIHNPSSF